MRLVAKMNTPSDNGPEKIEAVDTLAFKEETLTGAILQKILRSIILPLSDPAKRAAYSGQFAEASRNVEIVVEKLFALAIGKPGIAWMTGGVIVDWLFSYHGAQRTSLDQARYVVYTEYDHRIPFFPGEDTMYSYMISQAVFFAHALSGIVTHAQFTNIVAVFCEANRLGSEIYNNEQTIMPRFTVHDRLSLSAVQMLDKPLNCCPSLHIAYSLLIDNFASIYIQSVHGKEKLFESLRYSTLRMFNSVLYTKQHALVDVAFGMLCAKKAFETKFDRPFDDLSAHFPALSRKNPEIDYERILAIYLDISHSDKAGTGYLQTVREYFAACGFIKVPADTDVNRIYFETSKRNLVEF